MYQDHVRMLFKEYKNCLRNELKENLVKDDVYTSYHDKCSNQWEDIRKFYNTTLNKINYALPIREEKEILTRVGRRYKQFAAYGWPENLVRN